MVHAMITASAIPRLRACPSSYALARAETHNPWSEPGNEKHKRLAVWVEDRDNDKIADFVDPRLLERLASLIPPGARAEVKLGYDVKSGVGRVIGYGGGRDYGQPSTTEIVGGADVLAIVDGVAVVVDWKTGHKDVEPASSNGQLWLYALAAARAHRVVSARVIVIYTETGWVDSADLETLDLAEFATEVAGIHARVGERIAAHSAGLALETREGSWCRHCSSKAVCPSKNALLVQFGAGGLAVIGDSQMTPARAADAYRQIRAAEQLVEAAKDRLRAYVTETGAIDLGNGIMYGRYTKPANESLDAAVVVKAIHEIVGTEHAAKFESIAIERKATKAALERAAREVIATAPGKTNTAILKRVRELGGAKTGTARPIGEFRADKYEAAPVDESDYAALDAALQASLALKESA
jgi:hypothetical protein